MKILIVSTSDIGGGAARATYRLHRALLNEGVDSQMFVQSKQSDDYSVVGPQTKIEKAIGIIRPTLDQLPVMLYKNKTKTLFSPGWLPFGGVVKKINELNPDIVHLHWICGGFIRIEELAKIGKPIVWTLRDCWAFTGGCHYTWGCEKYKTSCGECPILGSQKEYDLSKRVFYKKVKAFSKTENITIVGLSRWITECAKQSKLLGDKNIVNIPNHRDTDRFKPIDERLARNILNLPKDKKLILFGAINAIDDSRKGFKELSHALKQLKSKEVEFIVFGSSTPQNPPDLCFAAHYLGHLHDDISLQIAYSASDVMVVPSLQENLSNTIMESLSCGTPVVAFDVGGNRDMIEHQRNGYLAKPYDAIDLAYGIDWVLNNQSYAELSKNARDKVLKDFDYSIVVKRYISLYQEILSNANYTASR